MRVRVAVLGLSIATTLCLHGAAAAPAEVPDSRLPNLVPLAPSGIHIGAADPGSAFAFALRFTTGIANRGLVPLELMANPEDPTYLSEQPAEAKQCVSWAARVCLERRGVGTFEWSTQHQHYHFTNFVRYELRRLDTDGELPDMSPTAVVAGGEKRTFCMEDTTQDFTWTPSPYSGVTYRGCPGLVQGISSGWVDEYGGGLAGQQISLNGVEDGAYAIVFTVNPDGNFLESRTTDNVSWTRVQLSNNGQRVTVI